MSMASLSGRKSIYRILPVVLLIGVCSYLPLKAQTSAANKQKKEQLENQMKKLQQEIKLIEQAIKSTSAKKDRSLGEILSLQAKIASREKLINNYVDQIEEMDQTIGQLEDDISLKTKDVDVMKKDYAEMLRKSYGQTVLQNETAFLLSSSGFFDAMRRYHYLLKIAEYRKGQAKALSEQILALEIKKEQLVENKQKKETLVQQQTAQKDKLEQEKKEKDKAVAQLQEKEKRLRKQIDEKNKAAQKLNARITAIIEDEIRLAKKKAEEQARKTNAPEKKYDVMPLTPQEQALSKDFLSNRGKLPWPVAKGHVVSYFGKREHPVIKGVIVENNGIDIKSEPGAEARALFEGTVVSVFYLPTTHNCVIVKHGEFFTVYSNIDQVSVQPNQTVNTKQSLGKLFTDKNDELTKVHIEIWKGKEKMDPMLWLAN